MGIRFREHVAGADVDGKIGLGWKKGRRALRAPEQGVHEVAVSPGILSIGDFLDVIAKGLLDKEWTAQHGAWRIAGAHPLRQDSDPIGFDRLDNLELAERRQVDSLDAQAARQAR